MKKKERRIGAQNSGLDRFSASCKLASELSSYVTIIMRIASTNIRECILIYGSTASGIEDGCQVNDEISR